MFGTPESLRSVMTANGDADKKIWMTEYGAPTNGDPGAQVTEAVQAQFVTDAYNQVKTYLGGANFWFQYRDRGTTTDTRENFFGLVRTTSRTSRPGAPTRPPRPAAEAGAGPPGLR